MICPATSGNRQARGQRLGAEVLTLPGQAIAAVRAQLPRFKNTRRLEGPIFWSGPVLASDRLIVASSEGRALAISPYDGAILGELRLRADVRIAPVLANETLFVLSDNGDLAAYR